MPLGSFATPVPLARAAWDGALCWDGEAGAVATYYQRVLRAYLAGHGVRMALPLRPDHYRALALGRRVTLGGTPYTVANLSGFDPADEAATAQLDLDREVQ